MRKPELGERFVPLQFFGGHWYQVGYKTQQRIHDGSAFKLFHYLMLKAGTDGKCFPTWDQITEETGMHRNRINRAQKRLEVAGLLEVERTRYNSVYFFPWHKMWEELLTETSSLKTGLLSLDSELQQSQNGTEQSQNETTAVSKRDSNTISNTNHQYKPSKTRPRVSRGSHQKDYSIPGVETYQV